MHLFVDISAHGLGHLAITAPVLEALRQRLGELRLTLRSALPRASLARRIRMPFTHLDGATDFGFRMHDALRVNLPESAEAYRQAHARWGERVDDEARFLRALAPDLVLSNVSALPLAGADAAGLPAAALCSLNWADLFAHHFGTCGWAGEIHGQLVAAYASARVFIRPEPSMPMPTLTNTLSVGPIARIGLRRPLGLDPGRIVVVVALGGIAHRLPIERWPRTPGILWLVPADWQCTHPDTHPLESLGLDFTDLLASVDAVLTKPGYGIFTEAACNGTPVLYLRRRDWPEQEVLIAWLDAHNRCIAVEDDALTSGDLVTQLAGLLAAKVGPLPVARGADEAAEALSSSASASATSGA